MFNHKRAELFINHRDFNINEINEWIVNHTSLYWIKLAKLINHIKEYLIKLLKHVVTHMGQITLDIAH
jgi:hypothetical protein